MVSRTSPTNCSVLRLNFLITLSISKFRSGPAGPVLKPLPLRRQGDRPNSRESSCRSADELLVGVRVQVTVQDLPDNYNLPFQRCVEDGRSKSLMCSYDKVNGVVGFLLASPAQLPWLRSSEVRVSLSVPVILFIIKC